MGCQIAGICYNKCAATICLSCGYTDMRKYIDGLAAIVQQNFQWLGTPADVRRISVQKLHWLLEGLSIGQPEMVKKLHSKSVL